jgi:5-oxoprolinase (ATP-hydrolysing)
MASAEQMGRVLQKCAVSLQIKERLDFSCAIFSATGDLVANAPHGKSLCPFELCL